MGAAAASQPAMSLAYASRRRNETSCAAHGARVNAGASAHSSCWRLASTRPLGRPLRQRHAAAPASPLPRVATRAPTPTRTTHLLAPVHLLLVHEHARQVRVVKLAATRARLAKRVRAGHLGEHALPPLARRGLAQVVVPVLARPPDARARGAGSATTHARTWVWWCGALG
jgi:hypothetical protein